MKDHAVSLLKMIIKVSKVLQQRALAPINTNAMISSLQVY